MLYFNVNYIKPGQARKEIERIDVRYYINLKIKAASREISPHKTENTKYIKKE